MQDRIKKKEIDKKIFQWDFDVDNENGTNLNLFEKPLYMIIGPKIIY